MSRFTLLNVDANAKTIKGQSRGFMTAILYLAPHDTSGTELCPTADLAGCAATCLNTAGRGGMAPGNATFTASNGQELPDNTVQRARLRRTELFNTNRPEFMRVLVSELERAKRLADTVGLTLVVRLNGTSDVRFESIPCERAGVTYSHIFAAFDAIQFYDYTKIPNRRISDIPNYTLTFSYSHRPEFARIVAAAVRHYGERVNFAAVFAKALPAHFLGRRVIDGDASDLRFLDRRGVVVGLVAKGRARRDRSGFVVSGVAA
jgi:hypothetical protein